MFFNWSKKSEVVEKKECICVNGTPPYIKKLIDSHDVKVPWTIWMTRKPKTSDVNHEPWTFWIVKNNKGYPIGYYYYHYDKQKKEFYWIRLHKRKKHAK